MSGSWGKILSFNSLWKLLLCRFAFVYSCFTILCPSLCGWVEHPAAALTWRHQLFSLCSSFTMYRLLSWFSIFHHTLSFYVTENPVCTVQPRRIRYTVSEVVLGTTEFYSYSAYHRISEGRPFVLPKTWSSQPSIIGNGKMVSRSNCKCLSVWVVEDSFLVCDFEAILAVRSLIRYICVSIRIPSGSLHSPNQLSITRWRMKSLTWELCPSLALR